MGERGVHEVSIKCEGDEDLRDCRRRLSWCIRRRKEPGIAGVARSSVGLDISNFYVDSNKFYIL